MNKDDKMALVVSQRDRYFSRMQGTYDQAKKCSAILEAVELIPADLAIVDLFVTRMECLDRIRDGFEVSLNSIEELNLKFEETSRIETTQTQAAFEELYFFAKTVLRKIEKERNPAPPRSRENSSRESNTSDNLKLPKVQIPNFSGNLDDWSVFYNLYRNLVHNNSRYTASEKFHILLTILSKEPLDLIRHLEISDANYPIAWEEIVTTYQNVRILATHYVDSMLNFKPIEDCNKQNLTKFLKVFKTNVAALGTLNIRKIDDLLILNIALRNLDPVTRDSFEHDYADKEIPATADLLRFVEGRCKTLELTSRTNKGRTAANRQVRPQPKLIANQPQSKPFVSNVSNSSVSACPACQSTDLKHRIYACDRFKALPSDERHNLIKTNRRCFNCLGTHFSKNCNSSLKCHCGRPHHSLLHKGNSQESGSSGSPNSSSSGGTTPSANHTLSFHGSGESSKVSLHTSPRKNVNTNASNGENFTPAYQPILGTAVVSLLNRQGQPHPVRILLDPGSQVNIISQACVSRLGLKIRKSSQVMKTVGGSIRTGDGSVNCTLQPIDKNNPSFDLIACVLPCITDNQPQVKLDDAVKDKFLNLKLADPSFDQPGEIDFLLGVELFSSILETSHNLIKGEPSALLTCFGWVLMGSLPKTHLSALSTLTCCTAIVPSSDPEPLDLTLRKFWETEEISVPIPVSAEDELCEKHFLETHYRLPSGRYGVRLPFKTFPPILSKNKESVERRLISLEKRLIRQPDLRSAYKTFMDEYIYLGHMYPASNLASYVIPHHVVLKLDSSTTKVRTVFDASFPSAHSLSMNSNLLSGPNLQRDLSDILCSFRLYKIAVCADIKMMYRQILVHQDDRIHQHIFYRDSTGEVKEFELATITYGLKPSMFLARRVLLQLAMDEGERFPLAAHAIREQVYVDDFCAGAGDVEIATRLQRELIELLALGCFELRKWLSNVPSILETIPTEHRSSSLTFPSTEDHDNKVLGIRYDPRSDVFAFSVNTPDIRLTKRSVLSEISKIFDPLGWLTPVTFFAKCIMQSLWQCGIHWDELLPDHITNVWNRFTKYLPLIENVQIHRFVPVLNSSDSKIIGFCDGSNRGFAAVIYITTTVNGITSSHLIKAKSRVAPLKTLSIPRIELCGALLLAKTLNSIHFLIKDVNPSAILLFSDSTIVLSWIKTAPHLLKTFVANRVVAILEHTAPHQWHHVRTAHNPADPASRGLLPEDLIKCQMWWKGPEFILKPSLILDTNFETNPSPEYSAELKILQADTVGTMITSQMEYNCKQVIENCSCFIKLKRLFAYLIRFINNKYFTSKPPLVGPLSHQELEAASLAIIRITQKFHYHRDFDLIKRQQMPCTSELRSLAPFIDESDVLRVGGRIDKVSAPFNTRHPIVIPHSSHLAKIICDFYHKYTLHGGPRLVSSLIQRTYWIPSLRKIVRHRIHRCIPCYLPHAKSAAPVMAELPASRLQNIRPFLKVAVDYAGPIYVKSGIRRNSPPTKGYLVVFVCLEVKAVHLELASDLQTTTFLQVLDRFISRRGICVEINSDQGTNLVGAARHLKEVYEMIGGSQEPIHNHLSSRKITWHFHPPSAPHFNGIAEAGVKSAKHHLKRCIGSQILTYEELNTLIIRVEAVLNSRPLGVMSVDSKNTDYLTPGHFLIGAPLIAPPEKDFVDVPLSRLSRFQLVQQALQSFWKGWVTEYLPTLIPRSKWQEAQRNLQPGELVFIRKERTDPLLWPIARIEEVMLGKDGVARVAKIRSSGGSYVRPVHCLVPLPQI